MSNSNKVRNKIYMGTIVLEMNRWSSRVPSYLVSEWIDKISAAGFEGLELWENHVLRSPGEAEKIKASGFPVAVYNTYADFTDDAEETAKRTKAAEMIHFLGADAVKYNVGNNPELLPQYKQNLLKFADALPADCVLLCECHQGTQLEHNDILAEFFDDLCPQKFALMLHPFGPPEELETRFKLFGSRIAHMHSQILLDDIRVRLDRFPERAQASFDIMKAHAFTGGFTIEFTELTASPGENIADLFTNAVLDMQYIRRHM